MARTVKENVSSISSLRKLGMRISNVVPIQDPNSEVIYFEKNVNSIDIHLLFTAEIIQKSTGLGINPLRSLLRALEKYDYVVTNPLSCFLFFIANDAHEDEIYRLLKKCPVNLEQAYNLSRQEEYRPRLDRSIPQYKEFQSENEANHKFKEL